MILCPAEPEKNLKLAFDRGEKAGITALLDVEDMAEIDVPDKFRVLTYLSQIFRSFGQMEPAFHPKDLLETPEQPLNP